ncbi:MAG: hypothetical protein WBL68_10080 [Nitrososphaeraceae archaeon]
MEGNFYFSYGNGTNDGSGLLSLSSSDLSSLSVSSSPLEFLSILFSESSSVLSLSPVTSVSVLSESPLVAVSPRSSSVGEISGIIMGVSVLSGCRLFVTSVPELDTDLWSLQYIYGRSVHIYRLHFCWPTAFTSMSSQYYDLN